jgi:hypothetical protein
MDLGVSADPASTLVVALLGESLWSDDLAYDAGHVLQVPLAAAMQRGDSELLAAFDRQFSGFVGAPSYVPDAATDTNHVHYLYLASRYLALSAEFGRVDRVPAGLVERVAAEFDAIWLAPAWMWNRKPFPGGLAERVRWKLTPIGTEPRYYHAIFDAELFPMAIAADLRQVERRTRTALPQDPEIDAALALALDVFNARVVPTATGGWLFQPGFWSDHPDDAYVGDAVVAPSLSPSPFNDVAEDSSHSHRMPLWLASLRDAYDDADKARTRYATLLEGLGTQFADVVLQAPTPDFPAFRTTNFMDGRNGVYRYNHPTQGPGKGYGPYELSGTFLLGWWAFTGDAAICAAYLTEAAAFPLAPVVITSYIGPGTSRKRDPIVADGLTNGLYAGIAQRAAEVCSAA